MRVTRWQGRMIEAVVTVVLLFVPLVLALYPHFARNGFPGPFTRTDAILLFFVAVPVLFTGLATYRVAQYYGVVGGEEDRL
ncbi:hypothetical protein [Haloarchaeobius sp. DYHT-AS-18]|uniref:hypothetical protein n=1 Tax=Haloarchaeobius sp. DYHT-AS-18 TaxID=3446117 RepID=UPI003EBF3CDB